MAQPMPWETPPPAESAGAMPWDTSPPGESEKVTPNVNLKSKKSKADFQAQMLQNMIASGEGGGATPEQEKKLVRQAKGHSVLGGLYDTGANLIGAGPSDAYTDTGLLGLGKQAVKMGLEGVNAVGGAAQRGLKSLDEAAKYADTALGTSLDRRTTGMPLEDRLNKAGQDFKQYEDTYQPVQVPTGDPSQFGQTLGHVAMEPVSAAIQATPMGQNDPRLAQKALDIFALGTAAGPLKMVGEVGKTAIKAAPSVASDIRASVDSSVLNPLVRKPAGDAVLKTKAFSPEDTAHKTLVKQQETAPEVVQNKLVNSHDTLMPLDRTQVSPIVRKQTVAKGLAGVDEFLQQVDEGRAHTGVLDEAGVPKPYVPGEGGVIGAVEPAIQAASNIWKQEYLPALQAAGEEGMKIGASPAADMLTAKSRGVGGGSLGKALVGRAEELSGAEFTPEQIQGRISQINDTLYGKGKDILPIEDTLQRNALRMEAEALRNLLDEAMAPVFEKLGTPGLRERFGAASQFRDMVLNGAEAVLQGKSVSQLPSLAGDLAMKAAGHYAWPYVVAKAVKRAFGQDVSPNTAFETLIRGRQVQGPTVRTTAAPPAATGPNTPMTLDPSTGTMIPAQNAVEAVPRTVQPTPTGPGPQMVPRTVGGGQPPPAMTLDPSTGTMIPAQNAVEAVPRTGAVPQMAEVFAPDKTSGGRSPVKPELVRMFEDALNRKAEQNILKIRAKAMGFDAVQDAIDAINLAKRGGQ